MFTLSSDPVRSVTLATAESGQPALTRHGRFSTLSNAVDEKESLFDGTHNLFEVNV